MRTLLILLMLSIAAPLSAAPMSAEEFDSYTQGRTFYYGVDGRAYGAEEYLSNRRVIWTFLDGRCQNGTWYQRGELICFEYEALDEVQCWTFEKSPSGGLSAQFENDPNALQLFEVERTAEPLQCLGPEVGV